MKGAIFGIVASLLSAATALLIANTNVHDVNPLWLLLTQYIVGTTLDFPKKRPTVPVKMHTIRLLAGLWSFGGYYIALSSQGSNPAEVSMILNTAPVFAVFLVTPNFSTRFGAIFSFFGIILLLGKGIHQASTTFIYLSAFSAACAYTVSIITLGRLAKNGEAPSTTNSIYNASAGIVIIILICIFQPDLPIIWWPVILVGIIAAIRIQILTAGAINPKESAKIFVLTNLSFIWLALIQTFSTGYYDWRLWFALFLILTGIGITTTARTKKNPIIYGPNNETIKTC